VWQLRRGDEIDGSEAWFRWSDAPFIDE